MGQGLPHALVHVALGSLCGRPLNDACTRRDPAQEDGSSETKPGSGLAAGKGADRPKEGPSTRVQEWPTCATVRLSTKVGAEARQPGPNRRAETTY